jgi:hypothetical protein
MKVLQAKQTILVCFHRKLIKDSSPLGTVYHKETFTQNDVELQLKQCA